MRETYLGLNPAEIKRRIARCQDRLIHLATSKKPDQRKEVTPPADHPWRRSSGTSLEDIFGEATEGRFEDILT